MAKQSMTHITDMSKYGHDSYWGRIQVNNVSHQKSFMFRELGGKRAALKAAKEWRDKLLIDSYGHNALTDYSPRRQPIIRAAKGGFERDLPVGVYRDYMCGSLYADGEERLYMRVSWRDHWNKKKRERPMPKVTVLIAGKVSELEPGDKEKIEECAIAFRREYERCAVNGLPFDPAKTKARLMMKYRHNKGAQ